MATACNEDEGFETSIEKTVVVDFALNTQDILNMGDSVALSLNHNIIHNDFLEYTGRINDVAIKGVGIQITNVSDEMAFSQSLFRLIDFDVRGTRPQAQNVNFFLLENISLINSELIALYSGRDSENQELKNAIDFIQNQLLLNEAIVWQITGNTTNVPPNAELVVQLSFDLVVDVQLR